MEERRENPFGAASRPSKTITVRRARCLPHSGSQATFASKIELRDGKAKSRAKSTWAATVELELSGSTSLLLFLFFAINVVALLAREGIHHGRDRGIAAFFLAELREVAGLLGEFVHALGEIRPVGPHLRP